MQPIYIQSKEKLKCKSIYFIPVAASALAADVTTLRLANNSAKPPYTMLLRTSQPFLLPLVMIGSGTVSDGSVTATVISSESGSEIHPKYTIINIMLQQIRVNIHIQELNIIFLLDLRHILNRNI